MTFPARKINAVQSRNTDTAGNTNSDRAIQPIAKVGDSITIGGVAGVDPKTGELAGKDTATQTIQILQSF